MLIQDKNILSNEHDIVKVFNRHYISIIKNLKSKSGLTAKSHAIDNGKQAVLILPQSFRL